MISLPDDPCNATLAMLGRSLKAKPRTTPTRVTHVFAFDYCRTHETLSREHDGVKRGEVGRAALYALASVIVSYAALMVGYQDARLLGPLP